jgi:hypothetical protein
MQNKAQDDLLDDKEYPIIRTFSLSVLELIVVTFTLVSIAVVFAPLTYKILVTNDLPPTEGDKTGLLLLAIACILKLLPFTFVLLFFRTSSNRYLDKEKAFEASYFGQLQQYAEYVAYFYIAFGALMTVLYGFSDYRTLYTISMVLTGVVILVYTKKTGVYIKS